jgi:hypothetical protein
LTRVCDLHGVQPPRDLRFDDVGSIRVAIGESDGSLVGAHLVAGDDVALAADLQASLNTITSADTAPGACGSAVPIVLRLNGRSVSRRAVQTRATAGTHVDRDALRLLCIAAP